jgi:hypothetical protein
VFSRFEKPLLSFLDRGSTSAQGVYRGAGAARLACADISLGGARSAGAVTVTRWDGHPGCRRRWCSTMPQLLHHARLPRSSRVKLLQPRLASPKSNTAKPRVGKSGTAGIPGVTAAATKSSRVPPAAAIRSYSSAFDLASPSRSPSSEKISSLTLSFPVDVRLRTYLEVQKPT